MTEEDRSIECKRVHVLRSSSIHLEQSVGETGLKNPVLVPCRHGRVLHIEPPPLRVPRNV